MLRTSVSTGCAGVGLCGGVRDAALVNNVKSYCMLWSTVKNPRGDIRYDDDDE
jgi:hypothetical protein